MKSINIKFLIPLLLLYFPFIALSDNRRGSLPPSVNCDTSIYPIILRDISTDDFATHHAGTLADEHYTRYIGMFFNNCSESNTKITVNFDNKDIDPNNGYLINHATGPTASDNVTFQLIDLEDNPINLNQRNAFTKNIDENNEAFFRFAVNYVKKDNLPPKPGNVIAHITFIAEANDQIVESDKIKIVD
ncbi:TPA: fimbrial protein [Proteus mirabilis]|nr:fimbrial protein [Proteus mirabilis]HCZ8575003.1 fimbrial protein [Proteus mirabilis]